MSKRADLAKLPAALWAALGIIAIPLLALITLQVFEAAERSPQLAHDRALVTHAFEVITTAEALESAAQDSERAQRGYLLTGDRGFLESHRAEAARAGQLLMNLRKLTADNPEQQRRIRVLTVAFDDWLAVRQQTIEAYDEQGPDAARQLVKSRAGLDTLKTVDEILFELKATERDLLITRQATAAAHEREVSEIATVSSAIGVVLLALGAFLTALAFHNARRIDRERHDEEKALIQRLAQTQEALGQAQKMEALGQLTGGVAHDFNNLLHVIKNAITIVQHRLQNADDEIVRYLEMAARNTERAASTTARLLAYSRQQPLAPTDMDVNKLVSAMSEMLRHALGESVALEAVLASGLWTVSADRNQLETAILNLGVNARDAMPGGGRLTIETSNAFLEESYVQMHPEVKPGQYVMIAVSDSGVGMTPEIVARAFEPFFTTKQSGEGTGLGLSQVYGFVKQSGGHIKIYSEPQQGTSVKIYLPRLAGAGKGESTAAVIPAAATGSGESILVVEDNEDVRVFTAQVLGELGYRVNVAPDGTLALRVLEELAGVDLLFTDVGLPGGFNGRALANEARRRWPRVKVLYTTGYARNSIVHQGRLDPDVELLTKPFTQAALASKIRRVLDSGPETHRDGQPQESPGSAEESGA